MISEFDRRLQRAFDQESPRETASDADDPASGSMSTIIVLNLPTPLNHRTNRGCHDSKGVAQDAAGRMGGPTRKLSLSLQQPVPGSTLFVGASLR